MMAKTENGTVDINAFKLPSNYCIKVQGVIDKHYAGYFGEMIISYEEKAEGRKTSKLTGSLKDQSELLGVLNALHNLRLPIISIQTLDN